MDTFAQQWTLESALAVLEHPTVDSKLWAEAVEWLLVYGPPEVRELLTAVRDTGPDDETPVSAEADAP